MITAIKPVFDRKAKQYGVEVRRDADLLMAHHGYYVTDSLAATLGLITAGKCKWFNGLAPAKQAAVREWLMMNV